MLRRGFLGTIFALPFARVVKAHAAAQGLRSIVFPVAGIAHNGYDVGSLEVDQAVHIREAVFASAPCFEIRDSDQAMIGYVPKKLVPLLSAAEVIDARVAHVRSYAVPWRQVQVELLFAPAEAVSSDNGRA
jgi:hypothetical protein